MYTSIGRIRTLLRFLALTVFFSGCAATKPYQALDPVLRQTSHSAEFVLVRHAPVSYSWEIQGPYSTYQREMQRDQIKHQVPVWQGAIRSELDLVEPYLAQIQNPAPVTEDIYYLTFRRALAETELLQLRPYSGPGVIDAFEEGEVVQGKLPYRIPARRDGPSPEWYLVLEVDHLGLMKTGVSIGGGNLVSAVTALVTTALTEKKWVAWFSGRMIIVNSVSREILWKSLVRGRAAIAGELEELIVREEGSLPEALVEAIAQAAAKNATSLMRDQYVIRLDTTMAHYRLQTEELASYAARLSAAPAKSEPVPARESMIRQRPPQPATLGADSAKTEVVRRQPAAEGRFAESGIYVGLTLPYNTIREDFDGESALVAGDELFAIPEVQSALGFGLVVGLKFQPYSIEFSYLRSNHDGSWLGAKTEATYHIFHIPSMKYYFALEQPAQPYLLMDFMLPVLVVRDGAATMTATGDAIFSGVGVNLGGGLDYYLNPNLSVSGGVLYRVTAYSTVTGISDEPYRIEDPEFGGSGLGFHMTMTYTFKKRII